MQEDDRCAVHAGADVACLLEARGAQPVQLPMDVVDSVGNVVNAGPALLHELADRGLGVVGRQQLELVATRVDERELETLDAAPTLQPAAARTGRKRQAGQTASMSV